MGQHGLVVVRCEMVNLDIFHIWGRGACDVVSISASGSLVYPTFEVRNVVTASSSSNGRKQKQKQLAIHVIQGLIVKWQ